VPTGRAACCEEDVEFVLVVLEDLQAVRGRRSTRIRVETAGFMGGRIALAPGF
jgi:hypothetical protein